MDVQIGRLLEHVDKRRTFTFFAGDNGTQGAGFNPLFNAVEAPNDPTRSKVTIHRNGVEVPFIVAGPQIKNKGRKSNELVTTTDIYATVLQLIGKNQPRATRRESISFVDVMKGHKGSRNVNVAEVFQPSPSVGGTGNPSPNDGRVVAIKRFRLLAQPVLTLGMPNKFVCRDESAQLPEDECLNPATGVYEKKHMLEFYDIKKDPMEEDALVLEEMSSKQYIGFLYLCRQLNKSRSGPPIFRTARSAIRMVSSSKISTRRLTLSKKGRAGVSRLASLGNSGSFEPPFSFGRTAHRVCRP